MRSTAGVPHALKMTVIYELPFGRGQRYGTDMSTWLDAAVGGWSLNLTGRVQSGTVLNFGNVRVVGMSIDELQDAFKIRIDPATEDRLHAAAGHHRQHDQGVQHQRDVGDRATARSGRRPAAISRRPTVRTASRSSPRRLRAARRVRRRGRSSRASI